MSLGSASLHKAVAHMRYAGWPRGTRQRPWFARSLRTAAHARKGTKPYFYGHSAGGDRSAHAGPTPIDATRTGVLALRQNEPGFSRTRWSNIGGKSIRRALTFKLDQSMGAGQGHEQSE